MQMTLPSHQREVTAHTHNLRGISSCLITAEDIAAQIVFVFYNGLNGLNGVMSYGGKKRSKSLLLSLGLRPCNLMRMLSHVSELPWLTIPIRLVCPRADRKPTKQNSCCWQYKMSLFRGY